MKSDHRHELKTNELAEWLGNLPEWTKENLVTIIAVVVVVVVVVVVEVVVVVVVVVVVEVVVVVVVANVYVPRISIAVH